MIESKLDILNRCSIKLNPERLKDWEMVEEWCWPFGGGYALRPKCRTRAEGRFLLIFIEYQYISTSVQSLGGGREVTRVYKSGYQYSLLYIKYEQYLFNVNEFMKILELEKDSEDKEFTRLVEKYEVDFGI